MLHVSHLGLVSIYLSRSFPRVTQCLIVSQHSVHTLFANPYFSQCSPGTQPIQLILSRDKVISLKWSPESSEPDKSIFSAVTPTALFVGQIELFLSLEFELNLLKELVWTH